MEYQKRTSTNVLTTLAKLGKTSFTDLQNECIRNGTMKPDEVNSKYTLFRCFYDEGCKTLQLSLENNGSERDFLMYNSDLERLRKKFPQVVPELKLVGGADNQKLLISKELSLDFLVQNGYIRPIDSSTM
jgi:hypothetical protein